MHNTKPDVLNQDLATVDILPTNLGSEGKPNNKFGANGLQTFGKQSMEKVPNPLLTINYGSIGNESQKA